MSSPLLGRAPKRIAVPFFFVYLHQVSREATIPWTLFWVLLHLSSRKHFWCYLPAIFRRCLWKGHAASWHTGWIPFPNPATANSHAAQLPPLANIVSPLISGEKKKKRRTSIFTVSHKGSVLQLGLKTKHCIFISQSWLGATKPAVCLLKER